MHKGKTPSYSNWKNGEPNNKEKVEHFGVIESVSQGRTWNEEAEFKQYIVGSRGASQLGGIF